MLLGPVSNSSRSEGRYLKAHQGLGTADFLRKPSGLSEVPRAGVAGEVPAGCCAVPGSVPRDSLPGVWVIVRDPVAACEPSMLPHSSVRAFTPSDGLGPLSFVRSLLLGSS